MEHDKLWPPLFILALILGGLFTFRYLEQVDKANFALHENKATLAYAQENLANKQELLTKVTAASVKLKAAMQTKEEAAGIQEQASRIERKIEGELNYTIKSMRASIEQVRADAGKTVFPEITLTNGVMFKGAKIRKVDDAVVTILHSNGITAVTADLLPSDILERFDIGPRALLPQLLELESRIGRQEPAVKVTDNAKLTELRKFIAQLELQVESATKYKEKLETEVQGHNSQIEIAEKSNPSALFNLRTLRDIAEGNAGQARNRLAQLKAELVKLKAEEAALLKR